VNYCKKFKYYLLKGLFINLNYINFIVNETSKVLFYLFIYFFIFFEKISKKKKIKKKKIEVFKGTDNGPRIIYVNFLFIYIFCNQNNTQLNAYL
jgi:hypothetical protein